MKKQYKETAECKNLYDMILELHSASVIQVHVTPMRFLACLVQDTVVILEVEDSYVLSADPHQRLGLNAVLDQKEQLVNVLNNRFYIVLLFVRSCPSTRYTP